jgi:hypothetical protein
LGKAKDVVVRVFFACHLAKCKCKLREERKEALVFVWQNSGCCVHIIGCSRGKCFFIFFV